jgi:DNA-binding transcriptional ArsR family regulator
MAGTPYVSEVMRALADPTRLSIYQQILTKRESTAGALTEHAGVSQPAVSQHLKALQDVRLITGRREGRNVFYRADPRGIKPLTEWLRYYERFWNESFDRLDDYLKELKAEEEKHGRKKR